MKNLLPLKKKKIITGVLIVSIITSLFPISIVQATSVQSPLVAFVHRMYETVLNRTPDPEGSSNWVSQLENKTKTGAEIAYGFFFSPEYLGKQKTNEAFVTDLYKALFDRSPDPTGWETWMNHHGIEINRELILEGFIGSDEFTDLCSRFGIEKGYTDPVRNFVSRLYSTVLYRSPDPAGLEDWAVPLKTRQMDAEITILGFFESPEYLGKNKSIDDLVRDLYTTCLNRSAAQREVDYWKSFATEGASQRYLIYGVAGSREFFDLCQSYGVSLGHILLTDSDYPSSKKPSPPSNERYVPDPTNIHNLLVAEMQRRGIWKPEGEDIGGGYIEFPLNHYFSDQEIIDTFVRGKFPNPEALGIACKSITVTVTDGKMRISQRDTYYN